MRYLCVCLASLLLFPSTSWCTGLYDHGRPLPKGKTFAITEFSVMGRLGGSNVGYEAAPDYLGQLDFGCMGNLSTRYALGGTVFVKTSPSVNLGIAVRLRRWLGHNFSADFSPGLGVFWEDNHENKSPSFTGSVRLSYRDYVALVSSLEVVRRELSMGYPSYAVKEKTVSALYLGVTAQSSAVQSKPGLVVGGLVIAAGVVALVAIASSMSSFSMGGWGD
jgi:hypothetical protein